MIVNTIKTGECQPQTIVIGRRGTYDTLQIAFDLSYLVESYGDGVAVLAVKRSQDSSAYPAVTSQEDDLLLWVVSDVDTHYVGAGECQLMWYVDGGLAKTIIYPMVVMRDILATSEEAPDAYQEWVDALIAEGAETLQNAQDAEQAKDDAVAAKEAAEAAASTLQNVSATATTLEPGSEATASYSDGVFSFGIPKGESGSGTSDYTDLTNKPQINGHTLTGNQTAAQLGLGTYSKPSGGIPKTDLASDVQTSLGKADTALQSAPVSSVAGKTGAVTLNANDVAFSDSGTYDEGTVGKELSQQKNAISQIDSSVDELKTTVTGSQTNAGGYTYPLPFRVGKTYYLTNTAASGTMNFNTYGNGAVIEQIKTSVQPNETVVFSPTLNADELRVYYNAANGSFKAEFGEVPEIWTKLTEIESSIVDVGNDINDVDGDLNKVKNQLSDIAIWTTGSQTNAGGYSYNLPFTVGNTYKLTNTAASGTVNFNTYDNGAVVEEIKTSVQPGETVVFSPTVNASQLRVYFPSANGSFKVVYGNFPNAEAETKKIPALETGLSDIESAFDASKYTIDEEFESGRYTASATVGQTYNPSKTSDSGWECIKLAVKPYDTITLYGAGTDGTLLWVLTDSSYSVLKKVNGAVTVTSSNPVKLVIAEDGYLFMSCIKSTSHKCIHKLGNGFEMILEQEIKFEKDVYPLEFDFDVSKIPAQSDFSITSHDPQDIYDLYDALMEAYPAYITRVDCSEADTALGVTRPSYLDGLPIYLYKFSPKIINTQVSIKRKVKIMVLTGVHSNEKWNMYNVARIMKYICENWASDKNAATIRTLVEYWIIPVVNPWGFVNVDTIQYAGRTNGNGVNLNRNAPASNWQLTQTGPDYGGPSAGSEYETKIWLYYHDLFKPDVFIDQHTPGMPETGIFGVLETDITKEYLANAGDVICREISNHLIINDTNTPDSADACLFDMFSDTNYGAVTLCAREHGTPYSFLFEMSDSSKWDDGVLTDHTVTSASSGVQIKLQMQNIYGAWQRLLYYASHDFLH